ncbi:glycoside hydrolase family protein [Sphingobacterium pedocola]|uniref:Glycosyl hydrolase family 43 n=1 Tax=Sphingobacterium pedocola TaxID=2082722 RepID=A0ABR9TB34_9SPHI|nr:glycoside hydrolase family protein [Sphingobacterium pedocola]MBE8722247.1 glycosyl hydrolase family 43 [Sphingobacterium pedocola]
MIESSTNPEFVSRKRFIQSLVLATSSVLIPDYLFADTSVNARPYFKLKPLGRSFSLEDYYIWCSSPIWGTDGKVHLFYSRWLKTKGMSGWIRGSEIGHAVADSPEGPFQHKDVALAPRAEYWDSTTCHNPLIKEVDGVYYLFYMGNSNGKTNTKRIGIATSDSLDGPWKRYDQPCLLPGKDGEWDDHCTTNPAFIKGEDGKYWLYYKSWNTAEYSNMAGAVRGNRKYGLAKADHPLGPYHKVSDKPVIDFSNRPNNAQLEDAFVWRENNTYKLIARDMGFYNHEYGLILTSDDGIVWSEPQIAYLDLKSYVTESEPPKHLKRFGRLERPMILFDKDNKKPKYIFGGTQGGAYDTATTFVFEIIDSA